MRKWKFAKLSIFHLRKYISFQFTHINFWLAYVISSYAMNEMRFTILSEENYRQGREFALGIVIWNFHRSAGFYFIKKTENMNRTMCSDYINMISRGKYGVFKVSNMLLVWHWACSSLSQPLRRTRKKMLRHAQIHWLLLVCCFLCWSASSKSFNIVTTILLNW